METIIGIALWILAAVVLKMFSLRFKIRELTEKEQETVEYGMTWVRFLNKIALAIVVIFASPYSDWAVENLGYGICIISMAVLMLPRRIWKYLLVDTLKEE